MKKYLLILLLLSMGYFLSGQAELLMPDARDQLRFAGAEWLTEGDSFARLELPAGLAVNTAAFLNAHGPALGLERPNELRLQSSNNALDGSTYQRYRRFKDGHPVLGGTVILRLNASGAPRRLSGQLLTNKLFSAPAAAPLLPLNDLTAKAKSSLNDCYPYANQWTASDHGLIWANSSPWSPSTTSSYRLCRAIEISEPAGHRAEMVYLDVHSGKTVFRHQLHCDINRRLYRNNTSSSNLIWQEGYLFPGTLNAESQELLRATEETYNLFYRSFGRQSYDGQDGEMRAVVSANLGNCPNANAWGNTVNHCDGVVSDDVVAHEWTHNYTRMMNGLIYKFESGAINEGFADIFGELVDLLNNRGTDTNDNSARAGCDDDDGSVRWKIGEDVTGFGVNLRDMWQPECKDDPSARNSQDYLCTHGADDNGGVHTNSGLVNRTFSLLTDGGTLNGQTIQGIGLTKAAHIFYHANANYLTPVTDFKALGIILRMAVHDLKGINLPVLTLEDLPAMASGEIITYQDSLQLAAAITATQLSGIGLCSQLPTLAQNPPENCTVEAPNDIVLLRQDWENGLGDWTVLEVSEHPDTWNDKPWQISTMLPDGRSGKAAFAPNAYVGDCNEDLDDGVVSLTSPSISLPANQTDFILRFEHYYSLEKDFDGGIIQLSVNGGDFNPIPGESFLYNGYDGKLKRVGLSDNPLAGEEAFHGADQNSTTGTWGVSIVDLLTAGAAPGDEVQLRWSLGQDGCNGWLGWFLDEVTVSFCSATLLPVDYLDFTANGEKDRIALNWATASEEQNEGFYVERSFGASFTELGFVPAGNGAYRFEDHRVIAGQEYLYRLRQRDVDGTENYSPVVSASLKDSGSRIIAYPNPVRGVLTIQTSASAASVSLLDMQGRRVRRMQTADGKAMMDTRSLPAGIYWLCAGSEVQRIVIR